MGTENENSDDADQSKLRWGEILSTKRLNSIVMACRQEQWHPAPASLYHYTDTTGLLGILKDGNLRLSEIFRMNDPSELIHGVNKFCAAIKNRTAKNQSTEVQQLGETFAEMLPGIVREHVRVRFPPFIASFSSNGDDLQQWRAYGANGRGFALEFNGTDLAQKFAPLSMMTTISSSLPMRIRVLYDHADNPRLQDLADQLAIQWENIIELTVNHFSEQSKRIDFLNFHTPRFVGAVTEMSFLFKHGAYAHEAEYRFLTPFENPDRIKIRNRGTTLIRYIDWDWRKECKSLLRKIIVGPAANKVESRRYISECLNLGDFEASSIEVAESTVPYDG